MSTVLGGIPFSDLGALQVELRPATGVPTTEPVNGGWAMASAANSAYIEAAGAAVPATAVMLGGLAFTPDGALYYTMSTTGTFADIGGHKVRSDGALLIKVGTPTPGTDPYLGGWAHDGATRAAYVGGGLSFVLPLADLGAGAVDTTLLLGSGSATFTRATAAATKLSTGLWKLDVASGSPRSSYIGLTTAASVYGGYLSEGAATQLAVNVRDMTQAAWVKVTMTTAQTSTGIDGVANSCTRLTAAGAVSTILQTLVAAASSRTYSCWMKRVTGTGTILIQQGATTLDVTALINSSTFTLVQLNASVLNSAFGITINTNTDAIDVDCNQFEATEFASTPIPSAGTRNADVLTYPVAGNLIATSGSCYAEASTNWTTCITGGSSIVRPADSFVAVAATSASTTTFIRDGTTSVSKTGLTDFATGVRKRASSYGAGGQSITGDGVVVATGAFDGAMTLNAIGIGCSDAGTTQWWGTVKNVRLWQRQLPDATLQAITA